MLEKVGKNFSPNLRRIVGNTAWLFGEKVFQLGLGLLVGVWVARYLGPSRFGVINYAIAYVGLIEPLAKLGLDQIIVRDLARDSSHQSETLGTGFYLKLLVGLTNLVVLVSTVMYLKRGNPDAQWSVAIFAIASALTAFGVIEFWFQSQVEAKYIVWPRNIAYICTNVLKVILIQIKAPLVAFVVALFLEQALAYFGMVIAYHLRGYSMRAWKFSKKRARSLLRESWPLMLSSMVIFVYMRIDQLMLGSMIGDEAVGIYSAAVKISEMWYFVPIAILQSVFPSIVQAKDISQETYNHRMQKILNLMALVSYSVAIPITLISPYLIQIMYGPKYAGAASMLTILVWSGLFASLGMARESWLTTEGLMKFSAAMAATGALVNVVLNYFLIPKYGGDGASIATLISQFLAAYLAGAFYSRTRPVFWKQTKALTLLGWIKR
ncbi:flippase [Oscillatoria sp. FACHB-1406]|uniref:flippase n=1 Tax=Oscillatoria sp. FACHB-1406 TaxID=2692846 RepID=UPI0016838CE9|nr:flippase [Oscillatoria sp. FACHB-1406]MBD2577606.1 flippase [Oscillatoria sp. FACHB-1406]